jgi:pimeloyl-ACP methyl ester carboxylesterase
MAGRDFTIALRQYRGPGLILNGENDKRLRRGEAKFAAALNPGRVEIVPGAGHACNLDNVDAYNRAVRSFARSIKWVAT